LGYSAEELENPRGIVRGPRMGETVRSRLRGLASLARNGFIRPVRMRLLGRGG
jgi:hypothetical protein